MNILIENVFISKEGKINSVILFGSCYKIKFDSISLINKFKKQIQHSLKKKLKISNKKSENSNSNNKQKKT